ncbi:rhodanese-related sulfurtransferase [Cytobacillus firmus]|uniref:oxygen-dependent tRNA uridine(34) hydroxylase TrhO n=1 Tax=Cytobacillus firmus TaxID=1399 RepID=UPI00077C6B0C|nr:rhodanese-related sulfurtransferase [Cytobacillus firmus]MBG9544322.1 sulfurtransferase [Cytobacillus firmus]MBG9553279.1 sulfurtransferase [Cytobacillus firmus]MBG9558048.1 sulfurtransferase [Cytobacillus firmus]MBG9575076.1 sulfurtransferase [Cytobacillus firmus]MEC1894418.1 rhodanese-related sulfurtransferase [Cytobacillus firmus]
MSQKPYRVLLYYMYVPIEDPEEFAREHKAFCNELGLKGRILVANEGINGTVSGPVEQTDRYMEAMKQDPRFAEMVFKIDEADGHAFPKMKVRARSELVTLRLEDDVNPNELTGKYLEPKEFFERLQDEDTIVLDARNDYEYDLGHFRGAIRPDIENFRDLPNWVRENKELLGDKKIITYCTGGIRCEKFSGWLVKEGFEDVAQLHGGIVTYGKDPEVQGQLWDGQLYVFDDRIGVPVNQKEHVIVGKDYFTGEPCERYVNCANPACNKKILCSEENEHKYMRSCSDECRTHPRNRYIAEHGLSEAEVEERLEKVKA